MPVVVKNIDFIRTQVNKDFPELGPKLAEALDSLAQAANTHEQQANLNATGNPDPPPQINGLKVSAQNGHFNIAIVDNNQIYRDVHYYVEHDSSPNFTSPHIVHLGHSRNLNLFLGNVTRYFRAYSAYSSSPPSAAVYHGTAPQPTAVTGGGSVGGPAFQDGQGSGTGAAGQGLSGPGPVPFRSSNGKAPIR